MGDAREEIIRLLKAEGFHLVRTKRHYIYRRESDRRIWVVPVTPSDHHTYDNNLKQLGRMLAQGRVTGIFEDVSVGVGVAPIDAPVPAPVKPIRDRAIGISAEKWERMQRARAMRVGAGVVKAQGDEGDTFVRSGPRPFIDNYKLRSALTRLLVSRVQRVIDLGNEQFARTRGYRAEGIPGYAKRIVKLRRAAPICGRVYMKIVLDIRAGRRVKRARIVRELSRALGRLYSAPVAHPLALDLMLKRSTLVLLAKATGVICMGVGMIVRHNKEAQG